MGTSMHPPADFSDSSAPSTAGSAESFILPNDENSPPSVVPHPQFWFEDGNIEFKVEDRFFQVHRYYFKRDSERFRALIDKTNPTSARRGVKLVVVDDVKRLDFERFLAVLYPSEFDTCALTTCNEWLSVLHISSEWGFQSIRTLAMREVFGLASPVDKIIAGRRYDIPTWLLDAYVAVCTRPEPLTEAEGKQLGIKDVIHIDAVRHAIARGVVPSELRREVWRACCPSVIDETVAAELQAETEGQRDPVRTAAMRTSKHQSIVEKLRKSLAEAEANLGLAKTDEAELVKAIDEAASVEEQRQQEEERIVQQKLMEAVKEAEAEEAKKLAAEKEKVILAARMAGDIVQAARLELERAEEAAAQARRAEEEIRAQQELSLATHEPNAEDEDDWFGPSAAPKKKKDRRDAAQANLNAAVTDTASMARRIQYHNLKARCR